MPLLPSYLLIHSHSLTLLTCAYFLLFQPPQQILASTPVWLLGESMRIRPATGELASSSASAATPQHADSLAAIALLLASAALTQSLFAGGLAAPLQQQTQSAAAPPPREALAPAPPPPALLFGERVYFWRALQRTWLSLAGARVAAGGALACWIYLFHGEQRQSSSIVTGSMSAVGAPALANRVVFAAALMDMLFWGYLWTVLREESRSGVVREKPKEDDE